VEKENRYNSAIDCMRIIAILAVVGIHTTTRILEASSFNLQGFTFTLFINQASRFAVPLFFMISGFVLELNYSFHLNYMSYLKKRFSRIFLPYVFWSAIYYYFVYTKHNTSFLQSLLGGNASYQLYFIPTLLIFYILFPFIRNIYRFIANRWMLILLGIIQLILLAYAYYIRPLPLFYPLAIALLNYYVFLLGMVASHHQDLLQKISRWKILVTILFGIFAVIVFVQGKTLYLKTYNYLYFYTQWRPSILLYTVIVAGLLYAFLKKRRLNEKIIRTFSKLSFFVFFIHVIVLEIFWRITGQKILTQEIPYNLLLFVFVVSFSYAIAYLVHKIPQLAKLTG
jgi:probable poly-beta-1,6-N-acetyl-D-glucosamine export protein